MFSKKYKCLFIHIPRTGGTSIFNALTNYHDYIGIKNGFKVLSKDLDWQHFNKLLFKNDIDGLHPPTIIDRDTGKPAIISSKADVEGNIHENLSYYAEFLAEQMYDWKVFTVVRNPWDRFVSIYNYLNKESKTNLPDQEFKSFVKHTEEYGLKSLRGKLSSSQHDFILITDFIKVKHKMFLPSITILKYEEFQTSFHTFCDEIDIPRIALPHDHKLKTKDYKEYYDDETKEIVRKLYKKDIELFYSDIDI